MPPLFFSSYRTIKAKKETLKSDLTALFFFAPIKQSLNVGACNHSLFTDFLVSWFFTKTPTNQEQHMRLQFHNNMRELEKDVLV